MRYWKPITNRSKLTKVGVESGTDSNFVLNPHTWYVERKVIMKVPTIIIEIPLYIVDENDIKTPFTDEQVVEALEFMKGKDDFCGYSINDLFVEYYDWEDDDND